MTLARQARHAPGHWAVVVAFLTVAVGALLLVASPPTYTSVTVEDTVGPHSEASRSVHTEQQVPLGAGTLGLLFGPPALLAGAPLLVRRRRAAIAVRGLSTLGLGVWGFLWIFSFGWLFLPAVLFMAMAFAHPIVIRSARRG